MSDTLEMPEARATVAGAPGLVRARGLTRRFGEHVAVHPFDLDVGPGGVTGLLGPNGSGKSTFLRMLVGLVRPDAGAASVDGAPLAGDGVAIRRRATYSPGEIGLYREMRGGEQLGWLLRGRGRAALARGRAIAERLDLPLKRRVQGYSHGMKRQLMFAAAMAPDVRVRILDEPTEGLDPAKRGALLDVIAADAAQGVTILLSSHHLGEVEHACSRLVFLDRGRVISDETPDELRARARRLLRMSWSAGVEPDTLRRELERVLGAPPLGVAHVDGTTARVLLDAQDPRAFFERLAAHAALPAPESLEYGRLSLKDLYRELYGVEGL